MIDQNTIKILKDSINIVDVIDYYLPLKKMGKNYGASCPFHDEKTSSFVVNEDKQFFHCFGCGAAGDVIKFVSKYEGIHFRKAVEKLCTQYNVDFSDTKVKNYVTKEKREQIRLDKMIVAIAYDYKKNNVPMTEEQRNEANAAYKRLKTY